MVVKQGRSSDILKQLYGDIEKYQAVLDPYQNKLIKQYPSSNLTDLFSSINKKMIAIAPMVFCESLLLDLGEEVRNEDLAALGLHMLAISTHDDVVDEMPQNRVKLGALIYAGNIASNEGSKILNKQGKHDAAEVLLQTINRNHFYQQHVLETLWQHKPESFETYIDGVHHICVFVAIGLLYALALCDRMDLRKQIEVYGCGYGIALQLIDDLRETEEDRKNGYWSFAITEGEPYTKSLQQISSHIHKAKEAISPQWKRLHNLLDSLEEFVATLEV